MGVISNKIVSVNPSISKKQKNEKEGIVMINLKKKEVDFITNIFKCILEFKKSISSKYIIKINLDSEVEEVLKNYYNSNVFSSFEVKILKSIIVKLMNDNEIYLNDDESDVLRDICLDTIDLIGYDENYNLTDNGIFLNQLIDKLYIG